MQFLKVTPGPILTIRKSYGEVVAEVSRIQSSHDHVLGMAGSREIHSEEMSFPEAIAVIKASAPSIEAIYVVDDQNLWDQSWGDLASQFKAS